MKTDIGIDSTGFLTLTRKDNGKLDYVFVTGSTYVRQKLEIELRLFIDECFTDTTQGVDWLYYMSEKGKRNELDAKIKGKIMSIEGIEKILDYSTTFDNANDNHDIIFSVQYNGESVNNITFEF